MEKYIPNGTRATQYGNASAFAVPVGDIVRVATDLQKRHGLTFKCITATDDRNEGGGFTLWYIFSARNEQAFVIPYITLKDTDVFPSLAKVMQSAWNFEKRIRSFFGLQLSGHPDGRQTVLHENWPTNLFPLRKDFQWQTRPATAQGAYPFQVVEGEGIYEIPVGPIHAGIIEPGHFRFSVAGEEIVLLEPRLGFVHKGSEKLFEQVSLADKVRLAEKISGDSSFSHSLAFCLAVEQLGNIIVPERASYLRVIFAELERLANHFGDIGAMMLDTGFNFGGSNGARLREMVMQLNERLTGSRFLRGTNVVGGVTKDIAHDAQQQLASDLQAMKEDFEEVIAIAEGSVSLTNRLKGTGVLTNAVAAEHGIVGVSARAAGIAIDTRIDFPYAAYAKLTLGDIPVEQAGDAHARFQVRIAEARSAMEIIQQALRALPVGPIVTSVNHVVLQKSTIAVSAVEGWRGEIVYFLQTDTQGNISRVAPRDPSILNWVALSHAGVGNVVPDFPLINKSFNLSYAGYDL